MSSCLCKKLEGAVFPFQIESLEDGVDDAVYAFHVHETHHRVRRRTSTKQRSMMLVVRSFRHRGRGRAKNDSSSGRSRSSCRTGAVLAPPAGAEAAEGGHRLAAAVGPIDGLVSRLSLLIFHRKMQTGCGSQGKSQRNKGERTRGVNPIPCGRLIG